MSANDCTSSEELIISWDLTDEQYNFLLDHPDISVHSITSHDEKWTLDLALTKSATPSSASSELQEPLASKYSTREHILLKGNTEEFSLSTNYLFDNATFNSIGRLAKSIHPKK